MKQRLSSLSTDLESNTVKPLFTNQMGKVIILTSLNIHRQIIKNLLYNKNKITHCKQVPETEAYFTISGKDNKAHFPNWERFTQQV